ncbi:MAG: lipopolysaccharide heptosyltransferase II [Acidobacteriaceae bacterium]|nr:lipopolysaccharide heptosyltransferase II [Acidobacteriaceae bacterium]MBV9781458.1 lipopolysaccharide heptosyltransferase II [Acidobacteriaceae bacterium]
MEFRNILVRAPNWVGDAVMSVPALHALRERFRQARISILARPWVGSLYAHEPFCDELICYDAPRGWRGFRQKWIIASDLRKRSFDCAVLFQNALEAAALTWLARIPIRIGYTRDARALLLTHGVRVPKPGAIPRHQRFSYLELLKRAGLIDTYSSESAIHLSSAFAAGQRGRAHFREQGLTQPIIGVSPGAAYGGAKRWLPERFAEAAAHVARERSAAVAVFGSKDESGICDFVCQRIQDVGIRCMNFAGRTTLEEFIELAAACEVYLTNDSGPMHIASALGVPTVAIFGATDETATGPIGSHTRVVREPVECSPCLLRECPIDHRCMVRVSADRVSEAALTLMKN